MGDLDIRKVGASAANNVDAGEVGDHKVKQGLKGSGDLSAKSVREGNDVPQGNSLRRSVDLVVPNNSDDVAAEGAERIAGFEHWDAVDYERFLDAFGAEDLEKLSEHKGILMKDLILKKKDLELIKVLIKNEPEIIVEKRMGGSWLHFAACSGDLAIVQFFLDCEGIDPNESDNQNNMPIKVAADRGHRNIVDYMLKDERICVNSRKELRESSLIFSAFSLMKDVFLTLIEEVFSIEIGSRHLELKLDLAYDLSSLGKREAGYYSWRVFKMFAEDWKDFVSHSFKPGFWEDNKDALVEHFNEKILPSWEHVSSISAKDVIKKINAGEPCFIPSGNQGHYENITVCGNWVAIGNRGEGTTDDPRKEGTVQETGKHYQLTRPGLHFYYIPDIEQKFGKSFVKQLLNADADDGPIRQIREWGKDGKQFYVPSSFQKRGNCTYSNGKLDLKAQLIFFVAQQKGWELENLSEEQWNEVLELVDEVYKDFRMFNAVRSLQRYEVYAGRDDVFEVANSHVERFMSEKNYGDGSGHYGVIELKDKDGVEVPVLESLSRSGLYV